MILGATGYTGTLVARELARKDVPFVIAGRNEGKLVQLKDSLPQPVEYRIATPDDPTTLAGLFRGVDVVINTVGPFGDYGEPVVRAALEQNVHYLDTTGEQDYMLRMIENHDAVAQAKKKVVICAQAFEYAVGECAAALALEPLHNRADRVEVFNYVRGAGASRGTVKSAFRMFSEPCLIWDRGRLVEEKPGAVMNEIRFPGESQSRAALTIPGGEPLNIHRYADVSLVRTCLVMPPRFVRAARYGTMALSLATAGPLRKVTDWAVDRFQDPPDYEVGRRSEFKVVARARRDSTEKICAVSGHDPYGITASIAVEGARFLLKGPPRRYGVISTAMAFDPAAFLDALKPDGVTWRLA